MIEVDEDLLSSLKFQINADYTSSFCFDSLIIGELPCLD